MSEVTAAERCPSLRCTVFTFSRVGSVRRRRSAAARVVQVWVTGLHEIGLILGPDLARTRDAGVGSGVGGVGGLLGLKLSAVLYQGGVVGGDAGQQRFDGVFDFGVAGGGVSEQGPVVDQ